MRQALLVAVILALALLSPHSIAGEVTPDEFVADWLSSITPFFKELIADIGPPQVSVVGEENLSLLGSGVTYNVTWVGEYGTLRALVTFAGGYPVRASALLEVGESAPWEPVQAMIDVYNNVTTYYRGLLEPYAPREVSGGGDLDLYWGATYLRVIGHPVYVALGEPAQVSVYLRRGDSGVIRLLIAEQLGALRTGDPLPPMVHGFELSESSVRDGFCGLVCRVEDIWLMGEEGLIPAYVVRSFSDGEGQVLVIDAADGHALFRDEWSNDELVTAGPKPLTWRDVALYVAVVVAVAPGAAALAWFVRWSRRHRGEELPVRAEALLIVVLLSGPITSIAITFSAYPGGSGFCMNPPGGLYIANAEQVSPTEVSVVLGFSGGDSDFVVTKLVARRGVWVSECVDCVFLIPRGSAGEVKVEFSGMPAFLDDCLLMSVYGHPGYEDRPYDYISGRVEACFPS